MLFKPINKLPSLPNSIVRLECNQNQLTTLPTLPSSLNLLFCYSNQLTSLQALSSTLNFLKCYNNQLTSLPTLPSSLQILECNENQLTSLPSLPNSLSNLLCHNNPLLACLPILPSNLTYLNVSYTSITCIPNLPAGLTSSLPICSGTQCEPHPTVSGVVYHDLNANGLYNSGVDTVFKNWIVNNDHFWNANSQVNGRYELKLDSGVVNNFSLIPAIPYISVISPTAYQLTPLSQGSQGSDYNFGVQFIPNVQDLKVDIIAGNGRPGFDQWCTTTVNNMGFKCYFKSFKTIHFCISKCQSTNFKTSWRYFNLE